MSSTIKTEHEDDPLESKPESEEVAQSQQPQPDAEPETEPAPAIDNEIDHGDDTEVEMDQDQEPEQAQQHDDDDEKQIFGLRKNRRYKSFRKKWRKMKIKFEDSMNEANALFIAEHKLWDTARRIQEQNDQLLDILLDLNESVDVPMKHRYNLHYSNTNAGQDGSETRSLHELERQVAHTTQKLVSQAHLPGDLGALADGEENHPGYLTSKHEEEYLNALDASLASIPPTENLPIDVETIQPTTRPRKRTQPSERDFAIQSPISVYNWMRKHQPQVFEGKDKEVETGRGASPPTASRGGRGGKKEKGSARSQGDHYVDPLDEELGFDPDLDTPTGSGSGRGKRNRDDEPYRPKGGKSRTSKRKRDSIRDEGEIIQTKKARRTDSMRVEEAV